MTDQNLDTGTGIGAAQVQQPEVTQNSQAQSNYAWIGRVKEEAYQRGLNEGRQTMQPQASQMGGIAQLSEKEISQMIDQKAAQKAQEIASQEVQTQMLRFQNQMRGNQIAEELGAKLRVGIAADPKEDLTEMQNLLTAYPEVAVLINGVDNTYDTLKHLKENSYKLTHLAEMYRRNPQQAQIDAQRLSGSIKATNQAAQTRAPHAPLDHLSPSAIPTSDNGEGASVDDFRKMFPA